MSKAFFRFNLIFGLTVCIITTIFTENDRFKMLETVVFLVIFLHAIQYTVLINRNHKTKFLAGTYAEKDDTEDSLERNKTYRKSILYSGLIFVAIEIIVAVINIAIS